METTDRYVGSWNEIKSHEDELNGQFLVVRVIRDPVIQERIERLERGLALVREFGKNLPQYPERQITLDVLYPDEDKPT